MLLTSTALAVAPPARAEDPPPTTLPPRPVTGSIDRVVKELEEEQKAPCRQALAEGKPCFPITTEAKGPEYSVRGSLYDLGRGSAPTPSRAPTTEEMRSHRPGPGSTVAPVLTIDPGCVLKSALKGLKGKGDVYFLYRVRDAHGARVALYDHRLDAATFQGDLEFLGRFEGECEALAAFRREERRPEVVPPSPPP